MIRAAGILIVTTDRRALFVQRSAAGDMAGTWCIPGGKLEDGEDTIDAAIRETYEEVGVKAPKDKLQLWTRTMSPDGEVEFTTYCVQGAEEFQPKLNEEHTAFVWAPVDAPPQPIHPGLEIALHRLRPDFTELDLAEAMIYGKLTSPQQFGNSWFFDMRITGTEVAFRHKHNEFVFRDPDIYLTDRFLQRCNGLPVILEHPANNTLDAEEYKERNIGYVFVPYIRAAEKEVWAITRIIDDTAAQMMRDRQLSTSPAVVWRDPTVNDKLALESGEAFLIEDSPSFVDHLAVCKQGVWDKGGEPTGIESTRGDDDMQIKLSRLKNETDDEYKARCDEVSRLMSRSDDAGPTNADVMKVLQSVQESIKTSNARIDALAKARADDDDDDEDELGKDGKTEKVAGDKKKADADIKDDVKSIVKHDDDDGDEDEKRSDRKKRADARRRADAFKFSPRKDDDDDSYKKRHDTEEKDCADAEMEAGEPEPIAADKAKRRRADAEEAEKKEHEAAADKKRGDSRADALEEQVQTLQRELKTVRAALPKARTDADIDAIMEAQARADRVEQMFGGSASRPADGESLLSYRRRLLKPLAKHHPAWSKVDLAVVAVDEAALKIAEDQIFKAAADAALSPISVDAGKLREVPGRTAAGHPMTTFVGEPRAWMNRYMPTGRAVKTINTFKNGQNG